MTIRQAILPEPVVEGFTEDPASLHGAAVRGDLGTVRAHLADHHPEQVDPTGARPLHLAAQHGHVRVAHALLEAGASANARWGHDLRPLHLAAAGGHVRVVHALLEAGARVDASDSASFTALHTAAASGHPLVVRRLLLAGADANRYVGDLQAVDLARRAGCWRCVGLLLQVMTPGSHHLR